MLNHPTKNHIQITLTSIETQSPSREIALRYGRSHKNTDKLTEILNSEKGSPFYIHTCNSCGEPQHKLRSLYKERDRFRYIITSTVPADLILIHYYICKMYETKITFD